MQSFKEFCSYHGDLHNANNISRKEYQAITQSCQTLPVSEVAAAASPELFIWIATSLGVAPAEHIRMFALWCAIQVKSFATDPDCERAITVCESYFNDPCPELLKNNFDLISTPAEVTKSLIDDYDVAGPEIRIVFDFAEYGYKRWWKQTETDDKVSACVHSAISTLSEAHCKELGFRKMNQNLGPQKKTAAMADSDNLTIGMHFNARMAADDSVKALGHAAADVFSANVNSDQYDEYDERETIAEPAMVRARKAQADWLKQNITLRLD